MECEPARSFLIDHSKLPPLYPTHQHDPAFWCSLGRAVAMFGVLDEKTPQRPFNGVLTRAATSGAIGSPPPRS